MLTRRARKHPYRSPPTAMQSRSLTVRSGYAPTQPPRFVSTVAYRYPLTHLTKVPYRVPVSLSPRCLEPWNTYCLCLPCFAPPPPPPLFRFSLLPVMPGYALYLRLLRQFTGFGLTRHGASWCCTAVLCCAVLRCAVLCCAVLCCAVLCCAVLR